jgi:hypothetical protein
LKREDRHVRGTLFNFMFRASGPVYLVPAIIAAGLRRPGWALVGIFNIVLWTALYLDLRSLIGYGCEPSPLPDFQRPGAFLMLIAWLLLLRFALSQPLPPDSRHDREPWWKTG